MNDWYLIVSLFSYKPSKILRSSLLIKLKFPDTTILFYVKLGTHWGFVTQYTYCNTKQVLCSKYCHNTCIVIHIIVS